MPASVPASEPEPGPPASETPPSGRSVPPQTPFVEPGACTHGMPTQQSAEVVHSPPFGMHEPGAPHLLLTQGFPQQSALVAHSLPAGGGFEQSPTYFTRQRGMPSASFAQQFDGVLLQLPAGWPIVSQQLFSALHDSLPPTLQMLPGSRHAVPLSQRPNSFVGLDLLQKTGPFFGSGDPDQPQQSLSTRQTSPVGWQPDGGWQTRKPFKPP